MVEGRDRLMHGVRELLIGVRYYVLKEGTTNLHLCVLNNLIFKEGKSV